MKFTGNFGQQPISELWNVDVSTDSIAVDNDVSVYTGNQFTLYLCGRIYNGKELAESNGLIFSGDAELAGQLYEWRGVSSFGEYDGAYTIIVRTREETIIYRDFASSGVPVYYTQTCFSSSLKGITNIKNFSLDPDIESFACFLHLGYIPSPQTVLKGVKKMAGGELLTYCNHQITVTETLIRTDFIRSHGTSKLSLEEAVSEYDRLHRQAIARRIAGKNNVALLLSGGYDSGGNIANLREVYSGKAKSFSIGFKDNPWSELPLAKLMADRFDTEHHEYEIDGSEIEFFPEMISWLGDPFQESGLMVNFMVMRMVAQHGVDVILGGDGNDQLYGTGIREMALGYKFKKNHIKWILDLFNCVGNTGMLGNHSALYRLKFHANAIVHPLKSKGFGFEKRQLNRMFSDFPDFTYDEGYPTSFNSFDDLFLNRNFLIDMQQTMKQVILFKASMLAGYYGQHLSFPYMSSDVTNFLKTLPREYKHKGSFKEICDGKGIAKYIHKLATKDKLPDEVTAKKKQGGFAPLPLFFAQEESRRKCQQIILGSNIVGQVLKKDKLSDFLTYYDSFCKDTNKWFWQRHVEAFKYFNLLTGVLWWEVFVNGKNGKTLEDFI